MKGKLREFITWVDLASRTNAQRGQVQYWQKRYTRLHAQIMNDVATKTVFVNDVPCFICSFYSENIPCKFDCSYHLLNNMYLQAKTAYTDATKDYEQLVVKRKTAWKNFTARKK